MEVRIDWNFHVGGYWHMYINDNKDNENNDGVSFRWNLGRFT